MLTAVSPRWFLPRVLLLVAVALGLGAMHTLGHAGMAHAMTVPARVPPAATATSPSMPMAAPPAAVDALMHAPANTAIAGSHRVLALVDAAGSHGSGGAWSVCLAVLGTAVLLLALARVRRLRRTSPLASPARLTRVAAAPRAPPPRFGLRVADLSVVRR